MPDHGDGGYEFDPRDLPAMFLILFLLIASARCPTGDPSIYGHPGDEIGEISQ